MKIPASPLFWSSKVQLITQTQNPQDYLVVLLVGLQIGHNLWTHNGTLSALLIVPKGTFSFLHENRIICTQTQGSQGAPLGRFKILVSYEPLDYLNLMTKVNPEILQWARETIGLTLQQAIQKLNISDARGIAAIDRLIALETGEVEPSRSMLVKMAKQYRRPLLTFYMSAPPRKGDRGQDFRTLPVPATPGSVPMPIEWFHRRLRWVASGMRIPKN